MTHADAQERGRANWAVAQTVVQSLRHAGITDVFIAPGARSTALVMALTGDQAHSPPPLRCHVVIDERSAAFAAVGLARVTGRPAAVVTTSGTAVSNLLPAATEASLDGVPLILLTADRPQGAYERGENQAISQAQLLAPVARWTVDLGPVHAHSLTAVAEALSVALYHAQGSMPGPVHVNLRFEKPLVDEEMLPLGPMPRPTRFTPPDLVAPPAAIDRLSTLLATAKAGLVVVGRLASPAEREAAAAFVQEAPWPTLACATASVPEPALCGADVLCETDLWREHIRPDVVLHLGASLVSERTMRWLGGRNDTQVVQVDPRPRGFAPFGTVDERIVASVATTLGALESASFPPSLLRPTFDRMRDVLAETKDALVDAAEAAPSIEEPAVARCVANAILPDEILYVGASLPIRDFDAFAEPLPRGAAFLANRGASGIDGVTSSALGAALSGKCTTLLLGDVSTLHDLSAIKAVAEADAPLRIVVVDNRGGNIFSFLPLARRRPESVDPWFSSPPTDALSFADIAKAMGVSSFVPKSLGAFWGRLEQPITGPELIVVRTDKQTNVDVHDRWRAEICRAVAHAMTETTK